MALEWSQKWFHVPSLFPDLLFHLKNSLILSFQDPKLNFKFIWKDGGRVGDEAERLFTMY